MERLTTYNKETTHENGVCCTHFLGFECLGVGGNCARNCKWEEAAWSRLAAYEDTGYTSEEITKLLRILDKGGRRTAFSQRNWNSTWEVDRHYKD